MYSPAQAATVQVVERRSVPNSNPVKAARLRGTPSLSLVDCPDPASCIQSERAEQDRTASLAFLHYLVMGPARPHIDSLLEREV